RGKHKEPEFPSIAKEGWLRPSTKCREATLAGRRRGGSFNRRIDSSGSLDEPPRPRQTRCLRAIFLDGAATPPLPRRGVFASYRFILNSSTSGALNFLYLGPNLRRDGIVSFIEAFISIADTLIPAKE